MLTIPKSVSHTIITFVDIMNGSIFVLNVDHQWSVAGLEEEVVDMCMQEEKDGYMTLIPAYGSYIYGLNQLKYKSFQICN